MQTLYKVESGIPIPPKMTGRGDSEHSFAGVMRSLNVGDSVSLTNKTVKNIQSQVYAAGRKTGKKYTVRKTENNGLRVWRTS